ncbi:MAG: ligase-associated DNA damage response exonuclease [Flavihumibacter sp.]
MPLIQLTENGLYCARGQFYIDPWKPVDKAVITHAHSDHARAGSGHYLCHTDSKVLLQLRLGTDAIQTLPWGEALSTNGISLSLHPAGHVIGSSQVRIADGHETWVVSGDYKTVDDGISGAFEPVACEHFVTESSFGLPIYQWQPQEEIYAGIRQWITENQLQGYNSVLLAYSLGKAQRVIGAIADLFPRIYAHGAVFNVQETLIRAGHRLPPVIRITPDTPKADLQKAVIIAPPGADGTPWLKKLQPYKLAICSGWMQVRGNQRRRNADAGFVLSDHADWPGLLSACRATGAANMYVTHGFQSAFSRYLTEEGIRAVELQTDFGREDEEA